MTSTNPQANRAETQSTGARPAGSLHHGTGPPADVNTG